MSYDKNIPVDSEIISNLPARIREKGVQIKDLLDAHKDEVLSTVHGGIVPKTRQIVAGDYLTGGGELSDDLTIEMTSSQAEEVRTLSSAGFRIQVGTPSSPAIGHIWIDA